MTHVDPAPARAAQGLPGGAQDDRDMGDRERSGAIVGGGLVTKTWISDLRAVQTRGYKLVYQKGGHTIRQENGPERDLCVSP